MANVHDLQRYVKRHPDDRAQRWRLAKKLYMAGDFDDALTHLRVLRKHWPTKLNVARYLAATYYRMGNNTDAIRELERSLDAWPDEVPIRQQLAHALEAAGLDAAATRVWQDIVSRQPNHPFAREALQSLSNRSSPQPDQPQAPPEAGRQCPSCGAENGDEFERCWQCHAMLTAEVKRGTPEPAANRPGAPVLIDLQDHTPVTITAIIVSLIAVMIAAYCLFEAWTIRNMPPTELPSLAKVYTVLATDLFFVRLSIAIVLAVFCPVAIYAASFATRTPLPSLGTIVAVGLANASLALVATLLPVPFLPFAPYLLGAAVFALIIWLFSPRYVRGAAIAAAQCVTIFGLSAGAAHQIEGEAFLKELPGIIRYGAEHDAQPNPGRLKLPASPLPADYTFQFSSTGSQWLNEHGALVRIDAGTNDPSGRMDVELFEYEQSLEYYWADPVIVPFNARLGRPYRLVLDGKNVSSNVQGAVIGILPVQVHAGGEPST